MSKLKEVLILVTDNNYTIDKLGVVRNPNGEILKGSYVDGYRKISVRTNFTSSFTLRVHKLQAYIKYGDKIFEKGIVVRHLNDIKSDNSWDNIVIGSQSQNMMDRTQESRKNHIKRKEPISDDIISEMENDRKNKNGKKGLSYRGLAKKYGISKSTIMDAFKRKLNK